MQVARRRHERYQMNLLTYCMAMLFALSVTHVLAQSPKIGFVNAARIEKESVLALQIVEELKKEFAQREQQLIALQKQGIALQSELEKAGAKMSPDERQTKEKNLAAVGQQFEQLRRSVTEDVEIAKREKLTRLLEQANAVVRAVAEAGKFDLIVQEAVYSTSQIDITDQVLKEIAKRAGK